MGMPLHFLGLREPLPRCLLGPPLAPLHLASFHPFAPHPRRAAGPCPRPCNPGARIPAPCTAERGQGSCPGTHRQSDRRTDGRTAPDGRAWRALRGPGGECLHPAPLSFSGSRDLLGRGGERPPNSRPGGEETCQSNRRAGRPPQPSWSPEEPSPVKGAYKTPPPTPLWFLSHQRVLVGGWQ